MLNFAILGAGRIAHTMAKTVRELEDVALYGVASREKRRAQAFAEEYGAEKVYDSYQALAEDPAVDLVYIATPHSLHGEHMKLCIENGRNVLCEKSFTMNAQEAEEVFRLAEEKGVFAGEAMWTRFLPVRHQVISTLRSGLIGELKELRVDFCTNILYKERMVSKALGGGALLDLGVYCLTIAAMLFGHDVAELENTAVYTDEGVDLSDEMVLRYADGKTASLSCAMDREAPSRFYVYGEDGYMEVKNLTNWQRARFYKKGGECIKEITCPSQISGYEYEVLAAKEAIENGWSACLEMPHEETLRILHWMDILRETDEA